MHEMHNRWANGNLHMLKKQQVYKVTYSNGMTLDNLPTLLHFLLNI
jgi:hypothetical protein